MYLITLLIHILHYYSLRIVCRIRRLKSNSPPSFHSQMNFGAAVRSAHFLGAAGVLSCDRNSAPLSPVVSKASAGALELTPIYSARNLPKLLADAAADGWQVLGAFRLTDQILID